MLSEVHGMNLVTAWRYKGGRQRQVETPGLHDRLTAAELRKKFLSLRGYEERQVYLASVMRDYPLQLIGSGLIPLFDADEKACLKTSVKIEWMHRLAAYSNTARRAFDTLDDRQQKLLLMVLAEKRSVEKTAAALKISRKRCNELYKQAVLTVFPEYNEELPPVRKLREQLAMLMEPVTSSKEQSGNSEDYLDHLAAGRESGECGYDHSDGESYGHSDEDRE